LMVYHLNQLLN